MTEELFQAEMPNPSRFERWLMGSMQNCECKLQGEHGPHDLWRHPIALPLIGFSLGFGLAPDGWSTMVKDAWREGHPVWAIAQAVFFFGLWLLSGVGLVVFGALFAFTTPLRWLSNKVIS